jgi:hypothetical protein
LFGRVGLEVVRVRVDGHPLDVSTISQTQQTVALHDTGREDWHEATLSIRATLSESEIADGPWAGLGCHAVLNDISTNSRTVRTLTKNRASATWEGSIPLIRSRHGHRASLTLFVVAGIGGIDRRIVGHCEEDWVIDLQSRTPTREEEIEIVQVDFRDGPHEWLRPYKDAPWLIDTASEPPTVYVNEAIEGLAGLLRGGNSPLEKATAALVNSQIVGETWTTMFHAAAGDLEVDEEGRPQLPTGWRQSVLRTMLPDILPGLSPADALAELQVRRTEGHGWAELQHRIQYAAGKRAQLPRHLTTTMRAVARSREGVTG